MELIERDSFLSLMHAEFQKVEKGEGHCILITGQSGVHKLGAEAIFEK